MIALSEGTKENLRQIILFAFLESEDDLGNPGSSKPEYNTMIFQHKVSIKELQALEVPRLVIVPGHGCLIRNLENYTVEGETTDDAEITLQLKYEYMEKKVFHATYSTIPPCPLDALQSMNPESILEAKGRNK